MTFLVPHALWLAALAIPIFGFYLLRERARQLTVPTLLFWDRAYSRRREASPWRRLRHFRSLLLQFVILTLLVLAAADPVPNGLTGAGGRVVLVIDTSASMSATDGDGTRLDRAKRAAERAAQALGREFEVAVVTAGATPSVVQVFTRHQPSIREAIRAVAATDAPTQVDAAVEVAHRLLGKDNGRVIVVSDWCFDGAERLAAVPDVTAIAVGQRVGNVGITRFQPRRSPIDPQVYEVLIEVTNWSDEARTCELDLYLNGSLVDVRKGVTIGANGRWQRVLPEKSEGGLGGLLTAKLTPDDALAADNEARAVLPERKVRTVILVADADRMQPGEVFVENALLANPLVKMGDPVPTAPATVEPGTLLVFYRRVPQKLPVIPTLVIDPEHECDLWEIGKPLEGPVLVGDQVRASPLLAYVRLDAANFPTARKIIPKNGVAIQPLVSTIKGDLLYGAYESSQQRVLVLATGPAFGDLPLRATFPILVANALGWLANDSLEVPEPALAGVPASALLAAAPPEGGLWLCPPEGPPCQVSTAGLKPDRSAQWRVPVGALDRAGIWTLRQRDPDTGGLAEPPLAVIPCNSAAAPEGDLRPRALPDTGPPFWEVTRSGGSVWVYLLVAALVLLVVEWWGYQRRWVA